MAILPTVSANKTKNPPTIPLHGIKYLWSDPIIILQTWGTTNPTKDITPAIAVDILAKNTATAVTIIIYKSELNPKLLAFLLPSANILHILLNNNAAIIPITE